MRLTVAVAINAASTSLIIGAFCSWVLAAVAVVAVVAVGDTSLHGCCACAVFDEILRITVSITVGVSVPGDAIGAVITAHQTTCVGNRVLHFGCYPFAESMVEVDSDTVSQVAVTHDGTSVRRIRNVAAVGAGGFGVSCIRSAAVDRLVTVGSPFTGMGMW